MVVLGTFHPLTISLDNQSSSHEEEDNSNKRRRDYDDYYLLTMVVASSNSPSNNKLLGIVCNFAVTSNFNTDASYNKISSLLSSLSTAVFYYE